MFRYGLLCGTLFVLNLSQSTTFAQGFGASPPLPGERDIVRVRRIFDETSPELGATLPDLTCYDAEGNEFQLRSLQGHHTVLLFGCLT